MAWIIASIPLWASGALCFGCTMLALSHVANTKRDNDDILTAAIVLFTVACVLWMLAAWCVS